MNLQQKNLCRIASALLLIVLTLLIHCSENPREIFINTTRFDSAINAASAKYSLPPALVRALIRRESKFDPDTVGSKGEIGLMQLLPSGAAAEWARIHKCPVPSRRELFDPTLNLEIGCWYLARAMRRWHRYKQCTKMALAQYNAGEKNVLRWKPETFDGEFVSRITWPGTKKYVETIIRHFRKDSVPPLAIEKK